MAMTTHDDESTSLVMPGQQPASAVALDNLPAIVWLRNPATGVINKFHKAKHADTIERCLKDGHMLSSEAAAKRQAVELARLQGRPLPPWATEDEAPAVAQESLATSESPAERRQREERVAADAREQNEAARKAFGVKSAVAK